MKDMYGIELKIGDKIKKYDGSEGNIVEWPAYYRDNSVLKDDPNKVIWVEWTKGDNEGHIRWTYESRIEKCSEPRPHADLIIAWAKDKNIVIQGKRDDGWKDLTHPLWNSDEEYRIKPKTTIVKKYRYAFSTASLPEGHLSEYITENEWKEEIVSSSIVESYTRLDWTMKEFEVEV